MKSKQGFHKEIEAIDVDITRATEYGEQQCEIDTRIIGISTSIP